MREYSEYLGEDDVDLSGNDSKSDEARSSTDSDDLAELAPHITGNRFSDGEHVTTAMLEV